MKCKPLVENYGKSEAYLKAEILYEMIKHSTKKQAIEIIMLNFSTYDYLYKYYTGKSS